MDKKLIGLSIIILISAITISGCISNEDSYKSNEESSMNLLDMYQQSDDKSQSEGSPRRNSNNNDNSDPEPNEEPEPPAEELQ